MYCKNCGQQLAGDPSFCPRCGAPLHHGMTGKAAEKNQNKKTTVIICLIVLIVILLGVIAFFLYQHFNSKEAVAVTEPATQVTETTAQTESPKKETEPEETKTVETAAEKNLEQDESFSISAEELEAEIKKIRTYYYTPDDDDKQIVFQNGEKGWDYSRDYRYHNGKLKFAFIFDGTEEHRLYFKDDHMIRYIDENGRIFDYPDSKQFSSWEQRALKEAYDAVNTTSKSKSDTGWIGTWTASDGEQLKITRETDTGLTLVFHKKVENGSWMDVDYEMEFDDDSRAIASEIGAPEDHGGWEYTFILNDGSVTVKSRYPDKEFNKD